GINPFYREGVKLSELGVEVLRDETQMTASSIIEQVAQVSLLRVVLPWMIGRAFEKLSEPAFMSMLAEEVPGGKFLPPNIKASLGSGVQGALTRLFPKYTLTGKTWAALTKSKATKDGGAEVTVYEDEGLGLPKRGAVRSSSLDVAGRFQYIAGGDGAGDADRQPGAHRDAGGHLRHAAGLDPGRNQRLFDAARSHAGVHATNQPGDAAGVGFAGIHAIAVEPGSKSDDCRAIVRSVGWFWRRISGVGLERPEVGLA